LPAPRRDHRPYEEAALVDQVLVGAGIVLANVCRRQHVAVLVRQETMRDIKLDRATAAGFKVNEQ
jgi:hypothetical protein